MSRAEHLRAVLPEKRNTDNADFRLENGVFIKDVNIYSDEHLSGVKEQLQDLGAAGFVPMLLHTEQLSDTRVRHTWEAVPGVDLREAPAEVRFSVELAIAVAELYIALQSCHVLHGDAGAHNCMWVGEHNRFHPVVTIDLCDLELDTDETADPVIYFANTLFEAWIGMDVITVFEGLVYSGKIKEFLPTMYATLNAEKEQGKLNLATIHPKYAIELLPAVFEALELYQKVDNRLLEFVIQVYSETPPSYADLERLHQVLQGK